MATTEDVTVALAPEIVAAVREAVAAGEYPSSGAAIGAALREWKERRENHGYTIAELRALIQEGIDSGPPTDAAEVFADLRERLHALAAVRA